MRSLDLMTGTPRRSFSHLPLRLIRRILHHFEDSASAWDTGRFGFLGSWSTTGAAMLWVCIAAACLFWPMPTL
ncbi:MAG TPA: hypothetical protein VF745_02640 [Steroidobacteraceae bacterium]